MIPQNLKILQLRGSEGENIGLYLTTRDDIENFQRDFDVVSQEAIELDQGEKELDPDWDMLTYIDGKLSDVFNIHRYWAEEVFTNVL